MSAPTKVYCLGDSVTFGQGLASLAQAYPRLLAERYEVHAKGICGETTRGALERFRDVQDSGCDVAVIQYGHNDCNRWDTDRGLPRVSARAFQANLQEMVARCDRFRIRPIFAAPHPTLLGADYERDRALYTGIMLDTCDEVVFTFPEPPDEYLIDTIHPNDKGHEAIAAALARRIT